jgi:SNF2 family DNA or RNA helicase
MLNFAKGKIKCLVTKPKIAGIGMNWQNCNKMIFVGLSDSWEQLYQATRRVWRFGQTQPVDVYIIIDEREGKVLQNIQRKDRQAKHMIKSMVENTAMISIKELKQEKIQDKNKNELQIILPLWIQEN